jgi:glycerophosphoryl diester phosphodiesterase
VALGADGVVLDVHATADGRLVVHHDPVIPGLGPIAGLRWGEVAQLPRPGASPVPLLEDALAALGGLEVWVEVKALPPEADAHLLAVLAAAPNPDRYAVHGFDHRLVARLGRQNPGLRRGVLSTSYPLDPIGPVLAAGARALWQEWRLIDAGLVRRAHEAGIEVIAWTVNDRGDAEALAAIEVDALCGNYPERLRMG